MKNFAEEIAYWYFRLNGFFLLENYVSHKSETETTSYADNDLIGIRPRNVREIIGLLNSDDTCAHLKKIIKDLDKKVIGIICEVKGGDSIVTSLNNTKLTSCIKRLGLLESKDGINAASKALTNSSNFICDGVAIHKIFVSVAKSNIAAWDKIEITTMVDFIKTRISKYKEKKKAWNHYGSSLLQYLLYEEKENKEQDIKLSKW